MTPFEKVGLVTVELPKLAVPVGTLPDDQLLPVLKSDEPGLLSHVPFWPNASHGVSAVAERRTTNVLPPSLGRRFLLIGDPKTAPQFGGFYHEFAFEGSVRMTQAKESMNLASATSFSLNPPASCVDSTISTLL